jgi:hypothetical protein
MSIIKFLYIAFFLLILFSNCLATVVVIQKSVPKDETIQIVPYNNPTLKKLKRTTNVSWNYFEKNIYDVDDTRKRSKNFKDWHIERCLNEQSGNKFLITVKNTNESLCDKQDLAAFQEIKPIKTYKDSFIISDLNIIFKSYKFVYGKSGSGRQVLCNCDTLKNLNDKVYRIFKTKTRYENPDDIPRLLIEFKEGKKYILEPKIKNKFIIYNVLDSLPNYQWEEELPFLDIEEKYSMFIAYDESVYLFNDPESEKTIEIYIPREEYIIPKNPKDRFLLLLLPISIPLDIVTSPLQVLMFLHFLLIGPGPGH